jgi:hypothetical protein
MNGKCFKRGIVNSSPYFENVSKDKNLGPDGYPMEFF